MRNVHTPTCDFIYEPYLVAIPVFAQTYKVRLKAATFGPDTIC